MTTQTAEVINLNNCRVREGPQPETIDTTRYPFQVQN
jgi:hypothetical protein